jgi:hypothetical protein
MAELAEALKALPAQICSHEYSYETFGSWCTVVRCKRALLRLVFDGHDREYRLDRSSPHKPDEWRETVWHLPVGSDPSLPIAEVVRAMLDSAR